MKKFLRMILMPDEAEEAPEAEHVARRGARHPLRGRDAEVMVDNIRFAIRLKDLSISGVAGLSDVPLQTGQLVSVELAKNVFRSGEVRWTRVAMAGVEFHDPLSLRLLKRLRVTIAK